MAQQTFLAALGILVWGAVLVQVVRVIRIDFWTLRVPNREVLILIGLYVGKALTTGFLTLPSDLFLGGLFFAMSFVMWLLRAVGAGDVKLYFALGLLIGLEGALLYVIALLVISIGMLAAIRFGSGRAEPQSGTIMGRLAMFRKEGKLPYAVPMCLAACVPFVMQCVKQIENFLNL